MQMNQKDARNYFFSLRGVRKWKNLVEAVVEDTSTYSFKNRYDRHNENVCMTVSTVVQKQE